MFASDKLAGLALVAFGKILEDHAAGILPPARLPIYRAATRATHVPPPSPIGPLGWGQSQSPVDPHFKFEF